MIKKFLALIILFLYTLMPGFAAELYLIRNATHGNFASGIKSVYAQNGYTLVSENPYYGTTSSGDYSTVLFKQSGNDIYCYCGPYSEKSVKNGVVKLIKQSGFKYDKITESAQKNRFAQDAQTVVSTLKNPQSVTIDPFNVIEGSSANNKSNVNNNFAGSTQNALYGYVAQIDAGTKIDVYLQNAIDTSMMSNGEAVTAILTNGISVGNKIVIPQGSAVRGHVIKVNSSGYAYRNGKAEITFDEIVTPDGQTYDISVDKVIFKGKAEGVAKNVAGKVFLGAALGALTGLLIGSFDGARLGRAVAISAGSGAAAGALSSVAVKGSDIEIPAMTQITIVLAKPFSVNVNY